MWTTERITTVPHDLDDPARAVARVQSALIRQRMLRSSDADARGRYERAEVLARHLRSAIRTEFVVTGSEGQPVPDWLISRCEPLSDRPAASAWICSSRQPLAPLRGSPFSLWTQNWTGHSPSHNREMPAEI